MGRILYGDELQKFIKDHQLECTSIIITIDDEKKTASYIIDGKKKIRVDYDQAKQYFNNY